MEKTVKGVTTQVTKLSSDYDLPAKAKQALGVAGELADTAIVKVREMIRKSKIEKRKMRAVVFCGVLWRAVALGESGAVAFERSLSLVFPPGREKSGCDRCRPNTSLPCKVSRLEKQEHGS